MKDNKMEENKMKVVNYILSQLICLFIHLIIILIFSINGYGAAVYFLYVTPVILLFMLIGYCCDQRNCGPCIYTTYTIVLVINIPIFLGVFFGVFNLDLQYNLTYINECKVIGQIKTFIPNYEQYQILYVEFKLNGENMLGYACSSSNYQQPASGMILPSVNPNEFLFRGERIKSCNFSFMGEDYFEDDSIFIRIFNDKGKCAELYNFSEVKLPSWMCSSPNPSSQDLFQLNSCYVHFYQGKDGTPEEAFQNSKNRQDLRSAKSFAYVSFTNLLAPLDQFMCFLVFIYCPIIVSLNLGSLPLTVCIIRHLLKQKSRWERYSKRNHLKS